MTGFIILSKEIWWRGLFGATRVNKKSIRINHEKYVRSAGVNFLARKFLKYANKTCELPICDSFVSLGRRSAFCVNNYRDKTYDIDNSHPLSHKLNKLRAWNKIFNQHNTSLHNLWKLCQAELPHFHYHVRAVLERYVPLPLRNPRPDQIRERDQRQNSTHTRMTTGIFKHLRDIVFSPLSWSIWIQLDTPIIFL